MKTSSLLLLIGTATLASHAHADARSEVFAAFDAAMAKKAYHVTMLTQVRGKQVESRTAVELPDTFHMTSPDSETIITPGGSWMRAGDQWMRLPMDMSAMVKKVTFDAMKSGRDVLKDVQATGEADVLGCTAKNYSYRTEGKVMGFAANSNAELSVCKDTGLPVRLITTDAKGKHRTEMRYDFETPVSIRPPR